MELLKNALLVVLLTTISAMPRGFRRHHDADISEQKMLDAYHRFIGDTSNSNSNSKESSESSESNSSEESKSSEEIIIPHVTTPAATTPAATTPAATSPAATSPAMTTVEDGSTTTPEVGTIGTDQPIVIETTFSPETPTPSINATPTCDQCFTVVIPTAAPITGNRGDN